MFSSEGVFPATPPPCTGVRSWIVSDPLYTVTLLPVVVDRNRMMTCAGQGRYSYYQPLRGFSPSWLAVIAVLQLNCGINAPTYPVRAPARLARFRRAARNRAPCPRNRGNCTANRAPVNTCGCAGGAYRLRDQPSPSSSSSSSTSPSSERLHSSVSHAQQSGQQPQLAHTPVASPHSSHSIRLSSCGPAT